jgi:hypothetical protein
MQFVFRNHIVTTINSNDIGFEKKKILWFIIDIYKLFSF